MSDDNINEVRNYYNDHVKEEDRRLDEHPFEVPLLMRYVKKYLTPGSCIFDVACGTGRIGKIMLTQGYFMGFNDLSDKNIELVRNRVSNNRNLLFIERSDALNSKNWNRRQWDAIFILGPLYHMISEDKRHKLLKLAIENLKPGGYVFSSFMTRVGAMVYGIKNNPQGILYPDGALKLWQTGTDDRFVESTEYFTNASFSHPEEINPMLQKIGLQPLHLAGAEGFFGERFELFHSMDDSLKKEWIKFIIENCEDNHIVQLSKHLLSIAKKPE